MGEGCLMARVGIFVFKWEGLARVNGIMGLFYVERVWFLVLESGYGLHVGVSPFYKLSAELLSEEISDPNKKIQLHLIVRVGWKV